jgi:hypothetical protein
LKYAIPIGNKNPPALKIIVGDEEIEQLNQNLAEFRMEHNDLKQIINPSPSDYYMMLMLEMWENQTKYDLCFIQHYKDMLDRGLVV